MIIRRYLVSTTERCHYTLFIKLKSTNVNLRLYDKMIRQIMIGIWFSRCCIMIGQITCKSSFCICHSVVETSFHTNLPTVWKRAAFIFFKISPFLFFRGKKGFLEQVFEWRGNYDISSNPCYTHILCLPKFSRFIHTGSEQDLCKTQKRLTSPNRIWFKTSFNFCPNCWMLAKKNPLKAYWQVCLSVCECVLITPLLMCLSATSQLQLEVRGQ